MSRLEAWNQLSTILIAGENITKQTGQLGALDAQVHELLTVLQKQSLVEFADLIQAAFSLGSATAIVEIATTK